MVDQHIEASLDNIRVIFKKVSEKIEALKSGERLPITKLSKDLAMECNIKADHLYHILKFLFKDYPGIVVKIGARGGIEKL